MGHNSQNIVSLANFNDHNKPIHETQAQIEVFQLLLCKENMLTTIPVRSCKKQPAHFMESAWTFNTYYILINTNMYPPEASQ